MNMKLIAAAAALFASCADATDFSNDISTEIHAVRQVREGRDTFRYATFGDEAFWGDGIGLHLAIAGAANGGVGPGVSPATAPSPAPPSPISRSGLSAAGRSVG